MNNKKPDFWFDKFELYNIENKVEVNMEIDKYKFNLRNDNLFLENSANKNLIIKNINFNNINIERLIGLYNIEATCYMNVTLQCFINNDMLIWYLLNKENYANIISKRSLCELTSCYWQLLANIYCNMNIKHYFKPKNFKEIIKKKNPLLDLINFMLE